MYNLLTILKKMLMQINKSAITVYKSTTQALTTSYTKIMMDTQLKQKGGAFTMSNGGVLVNKNCHAEVSANIYIQSGLTSGDTLGVQIWRNGTNTGTVAIDKVTANAANISIPPVAIAYEAGDYIYLYARNQTGARGTVSNIIATRLTVKEI